MQRLRNASIGIAQGEIVLFSDYENDGVMWSGEGPRKSRESVTFSEPFRSPPAVQVSISMWDISCHANTRADVRAVDVTTEGFVIDFRTWSDTRIARIRVSWTAIGELPESDDWTIC